MEWSLMYLLLFHQWYIPTVSYSQKPKTSIQERKQHLFEYENYCLFNVNDTLSDFCGQQSDYT